MCTLIVTRTCLIVLLSFFFFQAEDGIRDLTVTGVQTCALPICFLLCPCHASWSDSILRHHRLRTIRQRVKRPLRVGTSRCDVPARARWAESRSEERRVGKECSVDLGGRRIIKKKKI